MSEQQQHETHHSLNQVWNEIHRQGAVISKLETGQAAMESKLDAVASSLRELSHSINRPKAPFNWVGLAMLVLSILIAGGSYSLAILRPVESKADRLEANHKDFMGTIPEYARSFGKIEAEIEHIRGKQIDVMARLNIVEERSTDNEVKADSLKEWLRDVDHLGSRKWVNGKAKEQ